MKNSDYEKIVRGESVFTGGMLGLLGIDLATMLLSTITLGIAYPWLLCWKQSWYAEHTYINGRQLHFDGTGGQLIGKWLLWVLLTIVTLGIYSLWLPVKIEAWKVKHLHFAGMPASNPYAYGGAAPYTPPAPTPAANPYAAPAANPGYAAPGAEASGYASAAYPEYAPPAPDYGSAQPKHTEPVVPVVRRSPGSYSSPSASGPEVRYGPMGKK